MRLLAAALVASGPTVATASAPLSKACNESFARDCPGLLGGGTKCLICLHSHGADMMAHGCPNVSWPQPVFRVFCEGAAPPLRHATPPQAPELGSAVPANAPVGHGIGISTAMQRSTSTSSYE